MRWYGGSIAEAVNLSKQKNAIFVVFIEGDNDLSTEMAATLDDAAVVKRLSNEANFLAIKLKSGTTNYTHFAQIYQFVPVPSLFFIGRNGTPLEVVCAGVEAENLATRIDRILEEHYKEKPPIQPSTSSHNVKEQTVNLLQSEAAASKSGTEPVTLSTEQTKQTPVEEAESSGPAAKVQKTEHNATKSGEEYDVVCNDDVCMIKPKKPDLGPSQRSDQAASEPMETTTQATDSTISMEEKLEKAKELIEARRREKAAQEKELEKQKELERRNLGQGVAELKRWQADQELKQIQEERKREKMENNLARQRILEQIAQDRAERRARDQPPGTSPQAPSPQVTSHQATAVGDVGRSVRLQFKLPDGSSHTAHFDADDSLSSVQRYIADNLQMTPSSFSLWIAFPRRELTEAEATLRSLGLSPSAALLVLPRRVAPVVAKPSPFAALITFFSQFFTSFILEPSQQFYMWLRGRIFPPPRETSPTDSHRSSPPNRGSPSEPRRSSSPGVRRRGVIHRLHGDRPADDDNNTWNGNSTQQM